MVTIEFSKEEVKKYIDSCIDYWRKRKLEPEESDDTYIGNERHSLVCACYIDAYQCMRVSIFGELKPPAPIPNEQQK